MGVSFPMAMPILSTAQGDDNRLLALYKSDQNCKIDIEIYFVKPFLASLSYMPYTVLMQQ